MKAVHSHNGLLKASISSATNAHRLGGGEAPPAIVSIFLGSQVSQVLTRLESTDTDDIITFDNKSQLELGVSNIPELLLDNTDRNRTSPFAFTGNRFEFRAVGSSANSAEALVTVVKRLIVDCKAIWFDGNGYSDQWKEEAARRGLDCETSVPLIFDRYVLLSSIEMFERTGVLSRRELKSRCEVAWETYTKKVQIEARVMGDLTMNHIVPVASGYQSVLLDNVYKIKALFPAEEAEEMSRHDVELIRRISGHVDFITTNVTKLIDARKAANVISCEREKAIAYHDTVVPLMSEIRSHIDKLELIVDDRVWTLPKYRELLFIR